MNALIILVAIAAVPFVAALVMRVNAIYLFTSVAAGTLLSKQWGGDLESLLSGFSKYNHLDAVSQIVLLVLPLLLCFVFLRKSMPSAQVPLHVVPLAATCASFAILTVNCLPESVRNQLYGTSAGAQANKFQNIIIAGTSVLVLVLMYITAHHKQGHGKKHKK